MGKIDFLKFYMNNKDKKGCINIEDLCESFFIRKEKGRCFSFNDLYGKNYLKRVYLKPEVDAECLLPKIYAKNGFFTAVYYPVTSRLSHNKYVISANIQNDNCVTPERYNKPIFKNGLTAINHYSMPNSAKEDMTTFYTEKAVKDILKMRLLDTASYNDDRHLCNFFYELGDFINGKKVSSIRTFDYGESGLLACEPNKENTSYYSNSKSFSDKTIGCSRNEIIRYFKEDEAVQYFLPKNESSEILGSVDFKQESENLKMETGFQADQKLINIWQKSFDDMAEELSK